ncbi:MAG TPA: EscR/YscR/HrcR family type III secretion system export apparatus protein [Methylothermaceae bacterium]|nr:EscR/YscR/HrcR family type III secretion system export apparatus protein [Methylothermaceae bacterium]
MNGLPEPHVLIPALALLSLVPFLAVMTTSFIKLVVVLSLVRNALGIQQIPPNMAISGLAIILTLYIMAPVVLHIKDTLREADLAHADAARVERILVKASQPLQEFLYRHAEKRERVFFVRTARLLWPAAQAEAVGERNLLVLIPAFTVTELTEAFKMGFLLYLPFIAIDLIISNILLAMGMMMVSPMTISLPFKLLLFVLLDGWTRLIHALVLSYQ